MELKTLGEFELTGSDFKRRDPLLILAYLTIEGPETREQLANLFFPYVEDKSDSLSAALRLLQKAVGPLLAREGEKVASQMPCDFLDFRTAFEAKDFERCLQVHSKTFLPGIEFKKDPEDLKKGRGKSAKKSGNREKKIKLDTGKTPIHLGINEWLEARRFEVTRWLLTSAVQLAKPLLSSNEMEKLRYYSEIAYEAFSESSERETHFTDESKFKAEELQFLYGLLCFVKSPNVEPFLELVQIYDDIELPETPEKAIATLKTIVKHNLEEQKSTFVGREKERSDIVRLLHESQGKFVSLVGAGGLGKTQLALHVAHDQLRSGQFPDGIYFVKLEDVKFASLIAYRIATTLKIDLIPTQEHLEQVIDTIDNNLMLLVLDNYEHVKEGIDVPEKLLDACKNLKVLVTSREKLGSSKEVCFELDGLPVSDKPVPLQDARQYEAIQLFETFAKQKGIELNAQTYPDIQRLCTLANGTPLVIELISSRLDIIPLPDLVDRLSKDIDLLASDAPSLPLRQRSMRATWEHSWKLLEPADQKALSQLAVFQGGFDWKAAEAVAGASALTLRRLIDNSLIRKSGEHRFDFLVMLQQLVTEKLGQDKHLQRKTELDHQSYYLALAKTHAPNLGNSEAKKALSFFDNEAANLQSAWARSDGLESLREFVDVLRVYQERRGLWEQQRSLLEKTLSVAKRQNALEQLPKLLNYLAGLHLNTGNLEVAEKLLDESLGYQGKDETFIKAETYTELGGVYYTRREFIEALANFDKALTVYQDLGFIIEAANALNNLGASNYQLGEYQRAIDFWEKSLSLQPKAPDLSLEATLRNNLGGAYQILGDFNEALYHLGKAKTFHDDLGDQVSSLSTLNNIGSIHFQQGNFQNALDINETILAQPGLEEGTKALTLNNKAMIFERLGRLDEARTYLEQALNIQERLEDKMNRAATLYNLSTVMLQRKMLNKAKEFAVKALDIARETNFRIAEAYALNFFGDVLREQGKWGEAEQHYQDALAIQEELADKAGLVVSYNNLAETAYRKRDFTTAEGWAKKSLDLALPMNLRPDVRTAKRLLARICQEKGQSEKALEWLRDVLDLDKRLQHPAMNEDQTLLEEVISAQK